MRGKLNSNNFNKKFAIMSTFLYTLLGLSVANLHCAQRKEISPCTCRRPESSIDTILVVCEKMSSFGEIVHALQDKFQPNETITLSIAFSQLDDIHNYTFQDLKMSVKNLKLNNNNISELPDGSFLGMNRMDYLTLSDNAFPAVPKHVLAKMPALRTLDIGRGRISTITSKDFKNTPHLQHLVLAGNGIEMLEKDSLPRVLRHLHLGRNKIPSLNGTLRHMSDLEWLFINNNHLTSLNEEFPEDGGKIQLIHASENDLTGLPQEFRNFQRLDTLFVQHNQLLGLNSTLAKAKRLKILVVSYNNIQGLASDEFSETESLEDLQIGFNKITALNNSLLPLRSLRSANITNNMLTEFSLQEIKGLRRLHIVDLSYNRINKLTGRMENVVEWDIRVKELRLEYNELRSLDGALMGLHNLLRLNLSHNRLNRISPDDLIGLDDLRELDLSSNQLTTLEETSKTFLPSLEKLFVSHNALTILEHDFHGLPVLCWADMSYNQIRYISPELVAHTRCRVHGSPSTMRFFLQDNPILCDTALPELISQFEVNNTQIYGNSDCTPKMLPIPVSHVSIKTDSEGIYPVPHSNPEIIPIIEIKPLEPITSPPSLPIVPEIPIVFPINLNNISNPLLTNNLLPIKPDEPSSELMPNQVAPIQVAPSPEPVIFNGAEPSIQEQSVD